MLIANIQGVTPRNVPSDRAPYATDPVGRQISIGVLVALTQAPDATGQMRPATDPWAAMFRFMLVIVPLSREPLALSRRAGNDDGRRTSVCQRAPSIWMAAVRGQPLFEQAGDDARP